MKGLILEIETLKKGGVGAIINKRIQEFKKLGKRPSNEIFKELCFCLLTANFSAERGIEIQVKIGDGFLTLPEAKLIATLRSLGYRYPNVRAKYIVEARQYKDSIRDYVGHRKSHMEQNCRDWIIKNIKGLGHKEASHFLRNIGYNNLAIVDFHIIDLLVRHGLVARPKTLTRAKYLEIESILNKIAKEAKLTLAELDLYLWYMETGKILK